MIASSFLKLFPPHLGFEIIMSLNLAPERMRALAGVTLGGIGCFVLTMLALHWLQPNLHPLDEAMSYYVHGASGWLLTLGLFSLGLGSLALAIALGRELGDGVNRGGVWCLAIWSLGVLLGAAFSADPPGNWSKPPSVSGSIHGLAAMIALVIFPVAALLLSRRFRLEARWVSLSGVLLILAIASAGSLVAFIASLVPVFISPSPPKLLGLTERILFAVYIAWLGTVAIGLRRVTT